MACSAACRSGNGRALVRARGDRAIAFVAALLLGAALAYATLVANRLYTGLQPRSESELVVQLKANTRAGQVWALRDAPRARFTVPRHAFDRPKAEPGARYRLRVQHGYAGAMTVSVDAFLLAERVE